MKNLYPKLLIILFAVSVITSCPVIPEYEIKVIDLTDMEPEIDGTPNTSDTIKSAQYEKNNISWKDKDGKTISTFTDGMECELTFDLKAKEGCSFNISRFITTGTVINTDPIDETEIRGVTVVFPKLQEWEKNPGGGGPTVITTKAIPGVTKPATGGTPVTTITATQYNGTVTWAPDDATFEASTVYTATITLTANAGYTLIGVSADFFTVAGASTVNNTANSGVVTAEFPETEADAPAPGP
jgi:hypothetical protein